MLRFDVRPLLWTQKAFERRYAVDFMPVVYGKVFILSQFEVARLREDKVRGWLAFKRCACTERSFTD
jgi:hypothetical protein